MHKTSVLKHIKELRREIFTTSELSAVSGKSLSNVTQALNFLQKQGVVFKIYRGIWAEVTSKPLSSYEVIPYLLQGQRAYVSFISALHLYGIIEQIPQTVTLASLTHTKVINTKIMTFLIHRITPAFFKGFDWYKKTGNFLIAEPEKALIDCLYLSAYRKKQFGHFPELHFSKSFSFREAENWVKQIPNGKVKVFVRKKLEIIKQQ